MNRLKNNDGFMGPTHSLSAIAFYLLLVAFIPSFIYVEVLQTKDILIFTASLFVVAGSAVLCDLDNSTSTAINTLGLLGRVLSKLMRVSATMIYYATKTKRDEKVCNPHRGFWHTIPSAIIVFLFVFFTTSITHIIKVPLINKEVSIGFCFALLYIYITFQLALSAIISTQIKKVKSSFMGSISLLITGLIFSLSILVLSPSTLSYRWVAYCMMLGYIFHIIGDSMTVAGVPLFFPFKVKGKRWWNHRFLKLKAGGEIEKTIILPLFIIISVACLIKILLP